MKKRKWSTAHRFSDKIAQPGCFEIVPLHLINHLGKLGLRPTEAMFALNLLVYKWTDKNPFPSQKTIAKNMNVSLTTIRKAKRTLIKKGYLVKVNRYRVFGEKQSKCPTSHEYDLTGLFDAIDALIDIKQNGDF